MPTDRESFPSPTSRARQGDSTRPTREDHARRGEGPSLRSLRSNPLARTASSGSQTSFRCWAEPGYRKVRQAFQLVGSCPGRALRFDPQTSWLPLRHATRRGPKGANLAEALEALLAIAAESPHRDGSAVHRAIIGGVSDESSPKDDALDLTARELRHRSIEKCLQRKKLLDPLEPLTLGCATQSFRKQSRFEIGAHRQVFIVTTPLRNISDRSCRGWMR